MVKDQRTLGLEATIIVLVIFMPVEVASIVRQFREEHLFEPGAQILLESVETHPNVVLLVQQKHCRSMLAELPSWQCCKSFAGTTSDVKAQLFQVLQSTTDSNKVSGFPVLRYHSEHHFLIAHPLVVLVSLIGDNL
jgi:hypothetical protein